MSKAVIGTIVAFVVVVLGGLYWSTYDALETQRQNIIRAWTPLDGVLRERYDSMPQLVVELTLYVGRELPEASQIGPTYQQFLQAGSLDAQVNAAVAMENLLQALEQRIAESDPGISASYQYNAIVSKLQSTGAMMKPEVAAYNAAAQQYNLFSEVFPRNLIGASMGFPMAFPYFQQQP